MDSMTLKLQADEKVKRCWIFTPKYDVSLSTSGPGDNPTI